MLVVYEIGYLPINHAGAALFFQLMSGRYEKASTVLTSNKDFEQWGEVLGDDVMAAALIDQVLHHCHLVNIRGNSYRCENIQRCIGRCFNPTSQSPMSPPGGLGNQGQPRIEDEHVCNLRPPNV